MSEILGEEITLLLLPRIKPRV